MMFQIKQWLAPPVFPDDENKTYRAKLLNHFLLTLLILVPCLIAASLAGGKIPAVVTGLNVLVFALCLVLRHWNHQGRIGLAGGALMAISLVAITLDLATLGTIRAPTAAFYILLVVTAGLLFDLGGMIIMVALCSLTVAGLIIAENAGLLPHPDYTVNITQWATYTIVLIWSGSLTFSALQSMRKALAREDQEIIQRKQAEKVLRERQQFIETLINLSPDIIYIYDIIERKNVYSNDGILSMLGYSVIEVQEMGDQLLPILMHPEDLKTYHEQTYPKYSKLKDNEPVIHQYRMKHKKGDWHWLDCNEIIVFV